jgi:hypothetical protein
MKDTPDFHLDGDTRYAFASLAFSRVITCDGTFACCVVGDWVHACMRLVRMTCPSIVSASLPSWVWGWGLGHAAATATHHRHPPPPPTTTSTTDCRGGDNRPHAPPPKTPSTLARIITTTTTTRLFHQGTAVGEGADEGAPPAADAADAALSGPAKPKEFFERGFFERTGPRAQLRHNMNMDFRIENIMLYAGDTTKM